MFCYVYPYNIEGAIKRDKGDERAAIRAFMSTRMHGEIMTVKTYTSSGGCIRIGHTRAFCILDRRSFQLSRTKDERAIKNKKCLNILSLNFTGNSKCVAPLLRPKRARFINKSARGFIARVQLT